MLTVEPVTYIYDNIVGIHFSSDATRNYLLLIQRTTSVCISPFCSLLLVRTTTAIQCPSSHDLFENLARVMSSGPKSSTPPIRTHFLLLLFPLLLLRQCGFHRELRQLRATPCVTTYCPTCASRFASSKISSLMNEHLSPPHSPGFTCHHRGSLYMYFPRLETTRRLAWR